ncbi:MAG: VLRF1 family aeRF1-type release factor [Solirubrobacterales bacterium]
MLSLYVRIDPGDRSEAWRTEVRNALTEATQAGDADGHDLRKALTATAGRIQRDLLDEERRGEHRGLIGFVEISATDGEERWYATQFPPRRNAVLRGPVAQIHQLLEVLDDGAPLGVAAVSSERVRLLDWRLGRAEQLHDWELEYFADDWKERKSKRPDPARGEAVSASGRDQYDQRLEANRERFADQTGRLAHAESRKRGWRGAVVYGDERYVRKFSQGFDDNSALVHLDGDLVSETVALIEEKVEEALPRLNRDREAALIDRIKEAAYAEGRSSLGLQETFQALGEGRVEHLVYDAGIAYADVGFDDSADGEDDGLPVIERMIGMALSTGAAITPIEGDSAAALDEQGGVAALLRY